MTDTINEIQAIAQRHGLRMDELQALLTETDVLRGLVGPAEVEAGLAEVLRLYVGALSATAERVTDPAERIAIDRFLGKAMESLAGQLEGSSHRRN